MSIPDTDTQEPTSLRPSLCSTELPDSHLTALQPPSKQRDLGQTPPPITKHYVQTFSTGEQHGKAVLKRWVTAVPALLVKQTNKQTNMSQQIPDKPQVPGLQEKAKEKYLNVQREGDLGDSSAQHMGEQRTS